VASYRDQITAQPVVQSAGERSTDEGDRKAETFASQKSANQCNTFVTDLIEGK
jgi:hypothetical protein